jgi:hypothetical protein
VNWLGAGLPSFLLSLLGAAVGAWLHGLLLRHGIDFPPVIALVASLFAILPSKEASGLRGILVASFSCWAGAIVEIVSAPREGLFWDLVHFSDRLSIGRFFLYVACALVGIFLASRARPGAKARMLPA